MLTFSFLTRNERAFAMKRLVAALKQINAEASKDYHIYVQVATPENFEVDAENVAIHAFVTAFMFGFRAGQSYFITEGKDER